MNALTIFFFVGLATVFGQEGEYKKTEDVKGPYFGAYHGAYGFPPYGVRNDLRQIHVNNVAESVGAGIGTAKTDGVPGSHVYNYDNVPVAYPGYGFPGYPYPAFPYGAGAFGGFYGHGYGLPYQFAQPYLGKGKATVINHAPVDKHPKEAVKSEAEH